MDTKSFAIDALAIDWSALIRAVSYLLLMTLAIYFLRFVAARWYLYRRTMVWLEITPPSRIDKTPEATDQLFSVIHGLRTNRTITDRLLGLEPSFSFEITSTKRDGIRFLVYLENKHSSAVQQAMSAYIPEAIVKEVRYTAKPTGRIIEFRQKGHYVFPLTLTASLEQQDPLSYVTSAMANLNEDEQMTFQLVAIPVRLREADILSHKILGNENILRQVSSGSYFGLVHIARFLGRVSSGMTDIAGEVLGSVTSGHENYYRSSSRGIERKSNLRTDDRPARTLSTFEQQLMESMHKKVTQPLYQVSIRILVTSPNTATRAAAMKSAIDGFSVPPYQSLRAKTTLPLLLNYSHHLASRRLPTLFGRTRNTLAASELASLFHFPSTLISKTDNLVASLSRTLPAPVSLKQDKQLDVLLGMNLHHGVSTPIGLTAAERERHVYIIGGTGNGKTTMLQYSIVQDLKNGKGLAVIDPHGDMAETILRHIPDERIGDVVYFNPDDLEHPIGLNLLELTPGLEGNDLLREKDLITESVISVFRKIFSDDDAGGHRVEYILRNAIQTALTVENATLFTVFRLLEDPTYRTSVVKQLTDEDLRHFWTNELNKAGAMQRVKMAAGITAKIGRFLFSASARRILEQPRSTIDFEDIINTNKIFICNVSKGLIGEDASELFGITILAKFQLASLKRARIPHKERHPFYIYVDEFQNFATTSFVQMLSEARKYKLFLVMAEQSTSQQSDQRTVGVILANVGTVVCFRTGNPADEKLLLPLFHPYIDQGEISNLNSYNYYLRLAGVEAQEPLSGTTVMLDDDGHANTFEKAIEASRSRYAKKPETDSLNNDSPLNQPVNPAADQSAGIKDGTVHRGTLPIL